MVGGGGVASAMHEVAPVDEVCRPDAQLMHELCPVLPWYWPDAQERHAEELVAPDPVP